MKPDEHSILEESGTEGSWEDRVNLAEDLLQKGKPKLAATAFDRAFALAPDHAKVIEARQELLDQLAVVEHGIPFRFIPAGTFWMGDDYGEPDEQPRHQVRTGGFWLSETTVSWAKYIELMEWEMPPYAIPPVSDKPSSTSDKVFMIQLGNKIRMDYCFDHTIDHSVFKTEDRLDPRDGQCEDYSYVYDRKPMVAVAWAQAKELCEKISRDWITYRLPTESEWEKAARGGLVNCPYPWGMGPASETNCDCNRFDSFSILPYRTFPPNGYGLYAMSGSVWEWTSTFYDALAYSSPELPLEPGENQRVLRGGSWADCPEAVTVSFRSALSPAVNSSARSNLLLCPNVGFRLCRVIP